MWATNYKCPSFWCYPYIQRPKKESFRLKQAKYIFPINAGQIFFCTRVSLLEFCNRNRLVSKSFGFWSFWGNSGPVIHISGPFFRDYDGVNQNAFLQQNLRWSGFSFKLYNPLKLLSEGSNPDDLCKVCLQNLILI